MKTTSRGWPRRGCPGVSPMYFSALVRLFLRDGSGIPSGSGTRLVIGTPIPGLVPYVIIGSRSDAVS